MWRLFPKSWFPTSKPQAQRQPKLVDDLQHQWRRWLSHSLSRTLKRTVEPDLASAALAQLDARDFAGLDQSLRMRNWDQRLGRPWRGTTTLVPITGEDQDRAAYLFTAASDGNGFVREQALTSFVHVPGRLALVAALIRSDDWVKEVAGAAQNLLRKLLAIGFGRELFALLDLLLALQQRQRFCERVWSETIEPLLSSPEHAAERWAAAQIGTSRSRLYALELIGKFDESRTEDACYLALKSNDPAIANWAVAKAATFASPAAAIKLANRALRHANGSVRTRALRLAVKLDGTASLKLVERMIFDRAKAPRNAAAYELRTRHQRDPMTYWRESLDSGAHGPEHIAIDALAEYAQPQDIERLLSWHADRRAKTRASVLRGVHRANDPNLSQRLSAALRDRSSLVVSEAVAIARSEPAMIDRNVIESAFDATRDVRSRRALVRSARLLGKWNALEMYLKWSSQPNEVIRNELRTELRRWKLAAARQYEPLDPEAKRRIESQLSLLLPLSSRTFVEDLCHAVKHA
jgi:hypothetical protein